MKKLILIIVLSISLIQARGQGSGFSITGGIGTYDLGMLKSFQEELITRLPVEARGFNNFPPFTNVRVNLFRQQNEKLKYGLVFAFATTGASANYTDYSGFLNLDQEVTAHQLGLSASYRLLNADFSVTQLTVSAYGDLRLGLVRDVVSTNIQTIYYFYENNRLVLQTVSPMAEAGLDAMFRFNKVSLGLEGGILYDAGAKLNVGDAADPGSLISLDPSSDLKSGMSGLRGGIKLIFWLNQRVNPE